MNNFLFYGKHWPIYLGLAILRLIFLLPLRWQYALAKQIGLQAYKKWHRRRHIAEVNIRLCFPELSPEQQTQRVKENFIATAYGVVEIMLAFWASEKYIAQHSELHGQELLQQAQANGQGVLLLGIHVTSLEVSGRTLAHRVSDMDITYKTAENPAFDQYLLNQRKKTFVNTIEKYDMRTTLKNLKAGRIVWLASDQDFGRAGSVFVPFFNQSAATIGNLGRIVKMTNAKVLFYNHYRSTKNGKPYFVGEILDPFAAPFNEDAEHNASLYNAALEQVIRKHPEQYLWVHERFRTRPDPHAEKIYTVKKKKKKKKNG